MFTLQMTSPSFYAVSALATLSAIVVYTALRVIYNLFFSPLSAIPGPRLAAISDIWLFSHVIRFDQCMAVQKLFDIYGPVVRIGPNKVVFNDIASMRNIYSKFDKSTYYKSLLTNENEHAMTTLDHASHSVLRRAYAPHYATSNLVKFQPEMNEVVQGLVQFLDTTAMSSPVECLALLRNVMVDITVSTSYGYRLGAIHKWSLQNEDPLSTAIHNFPIRGVLRSALPARVWDVLCKIPNAKWRQVCDSDKIMAEFVSERFYQARATMTDGKLHDVEKPPMLHRLINYTVPSTSSNLPDLNIISECMGHLVAGADTSSTTIAYFFWELSHRPDIASKLQAEIDEVMTDAKSLPDIAVLASLPYLNAFIKEGLRLYGGAPSLLERVVPATSSKLPGYDGYDLLGFALPPGTIVATQAWSMHRNAAIFPSPDTFLPERWLPTSHPGSVEALATMHQHLIPFGTGSRTCGGQNTAWMAMRMIIASVSRNFDIQAPAETNERSMEQKDAFILFPASKECRLAFRPRV
ncbi:cytochrome P450 [Cylindrobasidium torrendii FP15055 ss-10]|uniref:Cytochrome P450 n=1 Tax=Cylindrobasidium torrendii FP15055 ss-10 TaxID=1314674 RepID=A0A0D7B4D8_9AGAR|nr:cytochrome P450 [Cylindrobasidium torrendii FP15055 ss-10]